MKDIVSKNSLKLTALLLISMSTALLASEGQEEPGIWAGDVFTSIFAILLFGAMVFVLGKYAWGPILNGLQQRESYISQQIKDAEQAKSDADKALRRYENRVARAETEAQEMLDRARKEAELVAHRLTEEAQAKAAEIIRQSQAAIESAREQAVRDLHNYSGELAVELAGKILGRAISQSDHQELIRENLEQLGEQ